MFGYFKPARLTKHCTPNEHYSLKSAEFGGMGPLGSLLRPEAFKIIICRNILTVFNTCSWECHKETNILV